MKDATRQALLSPSAGTLVAANVVPIFGVLFAGWGIFPLIFLYWLENGIIGLLTAVKMAFAPVRQPFHWIGKCLLIPFFMFHYGGFMAGHGFFIIALFGGDGPGTGGGADTGAAFDSVWDLLAQPGMLAGVAALVASHGWSLINNYFIRGEREGASIQKLMGAPYGRIVVLHIFIIASGFLIVSMGSPILVLVLFVALKTAVDLWAHVREHRKATARTATDAVKKEP